MWFIVDLVFRMQVETSKSGNAIVSLQERFRILIGKPSANLLAYSLWLFTESSSLTRVECVDDILFSGLKVGVTYPVWISLPSGVRDRLRESTHIFMSYGESWNLPFQWKVYPVSTGTWVGGSNWLFKHEGTGESVLIADRTCLRASHVHQPAFAHNVDFLAIIPQVHLATNSNKQVISLDDVMHTLSRTNETVKVHTDNPVVAVAAAIQAAHLIAHLPKPGGPVVIVGEPLVSQVGNIHSAFEWLSEDMQTYMLKCAKYLADRNGPITQPAILADLVDTGRVMCLRRISDLPRNSRFIISGLVDSDHLVMHTVATPDELVRFYKPKFFHLSNDVWTVPLQLPLTVTHAPRTSAEITDLLRVRYAEIDATDSAEGGLSIHIPSLEATVHVDGTGIVSKIAFGALDVSELIHLVC